MKRPLAYIGLTLMFVLTVCFYAGGNASVVVIVCGVLGLAASLLIKKLRKSRAFTAVFASALAAVLIFNLFWGLKVKPVEEKWCNSAHSAVGVVCEEGSYLNGRSLYTLRLSSIDSEAVNIKIILVSSDAVMCSVGDTLSFSAEFTAATDGSAIAEGVYIYARIYDESAVKVEKAQNPTPYYYAVVLRDKIRTALFLELDYDNAALASAVLLGDKGEFTDELTSNLRRAGISHIAVVSGLHLAVITAFYAKTLGKLIKNKYVNFFLSLCLILMFLSLTGFGKSSIRAAIMILVLMAADAFNREADSLNSLGLAAILICLANPLVIGDVGVLLSFSATFGIITLSTKAQSVMLNLLMPLLEIRFLRIDWLIRKAVGLLSVTVGALVTTLPVTVLYFGRASTVQLISNIAVVPLVKWFMFASFLAAVFHFIPWTSFLCDCFSWVSDLLGGLILKLAEMFASVKYSYIKVDYDFVIFWLLSTALLFVLTKALNNKGSRLKALNVVLSLLILVSGGVGYSFRQRNTATFYIMPAVNGQSVILSTSHGNAVLACSGKVYNGDCILNELDALNTEGDLMIVASCDGSSGKIAANILSRFDYERILLYDTDKDDLLNSKSIAPESSVFMVQEDFSVNLWNKAQLKLLVIDRAVYEFLYIGTEEVLILPTNGDVYLLPEDMRSPDVLITSGMIENMELLSFNTLICNGTAFQREAVLDFYRQRSTEKLSVSQTITFDIAG